MSEFATPGMRELMQKMDVLEPRVRKNIVRGMVYAAARETRDAARAAAPVETGPLRKQQAKQHRGHGNLRKSIVAKRRRGKPFVVVAGVFILHHAFYWRFVEYGHGGPSPAPEHPFARPAWDQVKHRLVGRMLEYGRARFQAAVRSD